MMFHGMTTESNLHLVEVVLFTENVVVDNIYWYFQPGVCLLGGILGSPWNSVACLGSFDYSMTHRNQYEKSVLLQPTDDIMERYL